MYKATAFAVLIAAAWALPAQADGYLSQYYEGSSGYASRYGGSSHGSYGRYSGGSSSGYVGLPSGYSVYTSRPHRYAYLAKMRKAAAERKAKDAWYKTHPPCGIYGRLPNYCRRGNTNTAIRDF